VGFVVEKVALGQVFSKYFCFPCQFSFHRLLHSHHYLSSGAGTICQTVVDVPSGLSLTSHPQKRKKRQIKTDKNELEMVSHDKMVSMKILFFRNHVDQQELC
jgi:hypothetical protein